MASTTPQNPIVNCHTHIFKGEHVPPFLARSFVPAPFYKLIYLPLILGGFKYYLKITNKAKYRPNSLYNRTNRLITKLNSHWLTKRLLQLAVIWLSVNTLFILVKWLSEVVSPKEGIAKAIEQVTQILVTYKILPANSLWWVEAGLVLFVLLFIRTARRFIFFVLKSIWKFLRIIPGKKTFELFERYMLLGRFALYKTQRGIFTRLKHQYPPDSRFIILPMDMEYMDAGKLKPRAEYKQQMAELVKIKKGSAGKFIEPFVFIDPRRIKNQPDFFNYTFKDGKVSLAASDVKEYIEGNGFSGFKIYPALGYYPFDEALLPLWKYAADEGIPIMTHCIAGTIFYRGKKHEEWNTHPIFMESDGKGNIRPLEFPQKKNINFSINFTHPLNYLCLLNEPLLRKVVGKAKNNLTKELFGYTNESTPLTYDLSHLKICLAHFGGEEEWVKYLETDRYSFAQRLVRDRSKGLNFTTENSSSVQWAVLEQIWKHVDWYSIICSLIIQNRHVYTDISYILSKPRILPLLKETLNKNLNPYLRERVLFGTDFYVVRNHYSEKDLMAQITAGLSQSEFDLIARDNPKAYLKKR